MEDNELIKLTSDEAQEHLSDEEYLKYYELKYTPEGSSIPVESEESMTNEDPVEEDNEEVESDLVEEEEEANLDSTDTDTESLQPEGDLVEDKYASIPEDLRFKLEAYDKITSGFKANGKELKVDNPDEITKLMQLGANYYKNQEKLKPQLGLVRMLDKHGMDATKLQYAIDVVNGDKNAIAKLLKDKEIDVYSLEGEGVNGDAYVPTPVIPSEKVEHFRETVDNLSTNFPESFEKVSKVLLNWDEASHQALIKDPVVLEELNAIEANGKFDEVIARVDKLKMLGHTRDMSSLEAFYTAAIQVNDEMQKAKDPEPAKVITRKVATSDSETSKKRLAMANSARGSTKDTSTSKTGLLVEQNLSDEEFVKRYNEKYKSNY